MITQKPSYSLLHSEVPKGKHYDKATEAIDMVRGILGVVRCAVNPDFEGREIYSGQIFSAVNAALLLAEKAQDEVDLLHTQLLSAKREDRDAGIS